jgi:hypothetical protein
MIIFGRCKEATAVLSPAEAEWELKGYLTDDKDGEVRPRWVITGDYSSVYHCCECDGGAVMMSMVML